MYISHSSGHIWSKNVFTCPIILVVFKNAIFAHKIIFCFVLFCFLCNMILLIRYNLAAFLHLKYARCRCCRRNFTCIGHRKVFLDKNPLNFLIEWITSKTYRTSLGSLGTPIFRKWEGGPMA